MKWLSWLKKKFLNQTQISATKNSTAEITNENELIQLLNEESRKQSQRYYEQHQNKYVVWNPLTDLIKTDSSPLTSLEIAFLKYIDSKNVRKLSLPGYWTYEYNLDFKYVISKLINNGYLMISPVPVLHKLKIDELKDILRKHKLKVSGKKADLIKRIEENIASEQLSQYFESYGEFYYRATLTGQQLIKSIPESVTKDIEFEDECLALLKKQDFNGAYKLVCRRESMKPLKRGINVDWNQRFKEGLPPKVLYAYQKLFDVAFPEIPSVAIEAAKMTVVFCDMLGTKAHTKLFNRLTNNQYQDKATIFLNNIEYEFMKIQALQEIIDLQTKFPNKYFEILTAEDERVCEVCHKFNQKRFPISKAKVGVNFPPFHHECRCTTIMSFKD